MTHKEALQILIQEAAKNVVGSGVGIREEVTGDKKMRVAQAIRKEYERAYGYAPDRGTFYNLGLPVPEDTK